MLCIVIFIVITLSQINFLSLFFFFFIPLFPNYVTIHFLRYMLLTILFSLFTFKREDFFELATVMTTRVHAHKLFKPRCTSTVRYNFFTERVIDIWNNLSSTVNFATLATFRQATILSQPVDFILFCTGGCQCPVDLSVPLTTCVFYVLSNCLVV